MKVFDKLLTQYGLRDHLLILTDKEDALIVAINKVFPYANHMLCQQNLHKNTLICVTKTFGDDAKSMTVWNQAWFTLHNASTEAEYFAAEEALLFLESIDSTEALFEYVQNK